VVVIDRISEQLQPDDALLRRLSEAGIRPGLTVSIARTADGVEIGSETSLIEFDRGVSDHVFVRSA
jgi:DtxR family Mn-dependent transcriptional regulator